MKKNIKNYLNKKILVISLQGIGDLLLATPLLHALKLSIPGIKISVLTHKANSEILSDNPDVDEVMFTDYKSPLKVLISLLNLRKRCFDISICTYPSGVRSAFVGYLSGASVRLGQDLNLFKKYGWLFTKKMAITEVKHAVLMNLDFLKLLGLNKERAKKKLILNLTYENRNFASEFLKANCVNNKDLLIAIHAGGGRFTVAYRCWPKQRFASLADSLIEKYKAKILFIGGGDDEIIVEEILRLMKYKAINAVNKGSLKQTSALIAQAQLLICNNSAPMHIAVALGIPTVSIFGSVDQRIHKPWGDGHIVLQKKLKCGPCYYPFIRDTLEETKKKNRWFGKVFKCLKGNYECILSINREEVIEAVEKILDIKKR